jgi:hypothetical protein
MLAKRKIRAVPSVDFLCHYLFLLRLFLMFRISSTLEEIMKSRIRDFLFASPFLALTFLCSSANAEEVPLSERVSPLYSMTYYHFGEPQSALEALSLVLNPGLDLQYVLQYPNSAHFVVRDSVGSGLLAIGYAMTRPFKGDWDVYQGATPTNNVDKFAGIGPLGDNREKYISQIKTDFTELVTMHARGDFHYGLIPTYNGNGGTFFKCQSGYKATAAPDYFVGSGLVPVSCVLNHLP